MGSRKLWQRLQKKHILKHKECLPTMNLTRNGNGGTTASR